MAQRQIHQIARAKALDNFASADQLDQRMVVVPGRSWLLLVVAVTTLSLVILWGFLGEVPHQISGVGLIIELKHPVVVKSFNAEGGVIDLMVPIGATVKQGDPIVTIENLELDKQVATATSYVSVLTKQDLKITKDEDRLIGLQKTSLKTQLSLASETQKQTARLIKMYETQVANLKQLVDQQLISTAQLLKGRSSLFGAMQQMAQQESIIAQAEAQLESTLSQIDANRLERDQEIARAENELARLTIQRDQATQISAPVSGRIIDHKVDIGSVVDSGTPISTILPVSDEVERKNKKFSALIYLPFGKGKQVRKNMPALVSLPYIRPSRYGYIKGKVSAVAEYVTGSGLAVQIGSQKLANSIQGDIETPLEITIELENDESTVSGLAWTSAGGYPESIPLLALCTVQVTVRYDRPIALVLPWMKDLAGIDQQPDFAQDM